MMIGRIQTEINPNVIDTLPVTFISVEENKVSNANLRHVLHLNACIGDDDDSRSDFIDFKGVSRYPALGLRRFQSERHGVPIMTTWQMVTKAPNHSNKT